MDDEDAEIEDFVIEDSHEDATWLIDLEAALLSDCDFGTLRSLCLSRTIPSHLRSAMWRICLNIEKREAVVFQDVFDLLEQSQIHDDCLACIDKMNFQSDTEKVAIQSDMESVVTEFCKRTRQQYSSERKWMDILRHLTVLDLSRQDLYHFFVAIIERYAVWNINLVHAASTLFRLLMLYHDPELCSFFDTKKVDVSSFLRPWLLSVFADSVKTSDVMLPFWDCYFLQADTFFVFFLAYVLVLNLKEMLLGEWKQLGREEIVSRVKEALSQMSAKDIPDFFQLSLHYACQTPASFRNDYSFLFFDSTTHQRDEQCTGNVTSNLADDISQLDSALCLQISVPELMQSLQLSGALRFFIVDCRPAEQYNSGHLIGSVYLDSSLLLDDPPAYNTSVAAVIDLQQSRLSSHGEELADGLGPSHICFVGSGREEEDKLVNMIIANFLQRQMHRVAVLSGGYAAVHEACKDSLDEAIAEHDEKRCVACLQSSYSHLKLSSQPTSAKREGKEWTQQTMSLMKGFGSSLKSRFTEVMSKGLAVAANTEALQALPAKVAHVTNVGSNPYRPQGDVFSMTHDDDKDTDTETVNISGFTSNPDVKHCFSCKLVDEEDPNQFLPAHLVITSKHVVILRVMEDLPEMGCIQSRKRLDAVMKITSRRQMPELITIKYGRLLPEPADGTDDQEQRMEIVGGDRLYIPDRAGEAASAVKYQIVQYLRSVNPGSDL